MKITRLLPGLLAVFTLLSLVACDIPDWVFNSGAADDDLEGAYPALPTVAATGTPIDAIATPNFVTPELPDVIAGSLETAVPATPDAQADEICTDLSTGSSLSYVAAMAIAQQSKCADAGDLLAAHLCNPNSGTWWLGLSSELEGCHPACVVNINNATANVNWRCVDGIIPVVETEDPTPLPPPEETPEHQLEQFVGWGGTIHRQPHGSRFAYRFLRDDGEWFNVHAEDSLIRERLAVAGWTAARVILNGEKSANIGVVNVNEIVLLRASATEPRDLSSFAMLNDSSHLSGDAGGLYYAWSVADGNERRPWCEGVDGPGLGEWLQMDFTAPVEITSIVLANGYDNASLFDANNRVQTADLYFDDELWGEWALQDTAYPQTLLLAGDVVPGVTASSIRLVLTGVHQGIFFDDTCIAEIEVWGRPAE